MTSRLISFLIAALVFLAPAPALAGFKTLLGVGAGGAAYDPQGVTFTPDTRLATTGALGVTNSTHMIMAWRARGQTGFTNTQQSQDGWAAGLLSWFGTQGDAGCITEACPGGNFTLDNANYSGVAQGTAPTIRETFIGTTAITGNCANSDGQHCLVYTKTNGLESNVWHSFVYIADTSGAQGAKKTALFRDDVSIMTSADANDGSGSLTTDWNNTLGFLFNGGDRANGPVSGAFDIADFVLDITTSIPGGCAASVTAANCASILQAYYDATAGKPVDLGPNGGCGTFVAAYGGSSVDVCHRGDKATFATEKGTASGTWQLVNPTTGSPQTAALWNAPYSQGNIPTTRPYHVWTHVVNAAVGTGTTNTYPSTANNSGATSGNNGNGILTGDLILRQTEICYLSVNIDNAIQTPAGWTLLSLASGSNPKTDTTTHCNYQTIWKVRTAASLGENTAWTSSDVDPPPDVNFTAHGTTAVRSVAVTWTVIRNANATTPIQTAAATMNTSSTSQTAPALTVTASTVAPVLLVTTCMAKANNTTRIPPSGEDLRYHGKYNVSGNTFTVLADEVVTSSGSTGSKTWTANTAVLDYCTSLAVVK